MRTLLISLRSPRAQPRGFRLRIRETAGTCFALKSMLSRRRHRFQIVFAFTCGHQKRFTNGNVWTRINLKTDEYLSVFQIYPDTCGRGLCVLWWNTLLPQCLSLHPARINLCRWSVIETGINAWWGERRVACYGPRIPSKWNCNSLSQSMP